MADPETSQRQLVDELNELRRGITGLEIRSSALPGDRSQSNWPKESVPLPCEAEPPHYQMAGNELGKFIDTIKIQELMDQFYKLTNIGVAVIDLKGEVLVATGWQDACTKFHRVHPETLKNCIESDIYLAQNLKEGEYVSYKCKNHMRDMATPIIIDGTHFGNIFLGQFFFDDEVPDTDLFRSQARRYGFDEAEYLSALARIPRWNRDKVDTVMTFYSKLASLIGSLSYSNLRLGQALTEISNTEAVLKNNHRRLEESQRIAKIGTFEWDALTGETFWTDEVYQIFGLEPGSVIPSYELARECTFPEDTKAWEESVQSSLAGKDTFQFEYRGWTKDKETIWIRNEGHVVRDENGQGTGIFGTVQDITHYKNLESQLIQSQKMEALGTLAVGIAHDFNNMLQVILGYADLLLLDKSQGDPGHDELQKIIKTSEDARDLVQKIRLAGRIADIQPRPVDLNHHVRGASSLLSRTLPRGINIYTHLAENLAEIEADPNLMTQMVMNLGINAGEAMPDGGTLNIHTENTVLDNDFCRNHSGLKPGIYILLTVTDTGRGIPKDRLERIYDPFYSTKVRDYHKGTGLGLSEVFGIVHMHKGLIDVQSEVGAGTTFRIFLPATEAVETVRRVEKVSVPAGGKETVLIVEDEDRVRCLGKDCLEQFGYTVLTATDGQEAIEVYQRERDSVALVILDIIMPRMDGKQCLQELLRINPNLKVLVSSGVVEEDVVQSVVNLGAKDSIMKPFNIMELLQKVRDVLDGG